MLEYIISVLPSLNGHKTSLSVVNVLIRYTTFGYKIRPLWVRGGFIYKFMLATVCNLE